MEFASQVTIGTMRLFPPPQLEDAGTGGALHVSSVELRCLNPLKAQSQA